MKTKLLIRYFFVLFFTSFHLRLFADEIMNLNGVYQIPSQNKDEEAYSIFPLLDYKVIKKVIDTKQEVFVHYTLPEELVGEAGLVVFMKLVLEQGGARVLEGEQSIALCFGKWESMNCDVKFKNLAINLIAIQKKLEASGIDREEKEMRLTLLRRFSGDPIGKTFITR
jgi:hypothetical protein